MPIIFTLLRRVHMNYELIATTTFGIESVTARELKDLGYEDLKVENGRVTFSGDEMDIAICNIWLRSADRILIKVKEFKATTFEELFQGTKDVPWAKMIPYNGEMHVVGKSIKSTLFSVPDCQSIVKKAVIESMKLTYKRDRFPEDGPKYKIEIALLKDIATLTIDTSGPGLHKRGYREVAGAAPLKETMAAALVLISKWNGNEILIDPFCGSGTIPIEAALIAKNIAPGLNRTFVCEEWPIMSPLLFKQVREGALKSINKKDIKIKASDIDTRVLSIARENARKAGVSNYITFERKDFREIVLREKEGFIISNPPYGERIGEEELIRKLYKKLGQDFRKSDDWKFYILTSYEDFEKCFGLKSNKNRKLFNGRLKCYYYQYHKE